MSRPQEMHLSDVLRQSPQLFDKRKLSAVEKFLTRIDILPEAFRGCSIVYLSKNSLTSLEGIQQFPLVHSLALSDNLIASFEHLEPLVQGCPSLQHLSLEGNPLAELPYYRSHVISIIKGLRMLDNKAITDEEREESERTVDQVYRYIGILQTIQHIIDQNINDA